MWLLQLTDPIDQMLYIWWLLELCIYTFCSSALMLFCPRIFLSFYSCPQGYMYTEPATLVHTPVGSITKPKGRYLHSAPIGWVPSFSETADTMCFSNSALCLLPQVSPARWAFKTWHPDLQGPTAWRPLRPGEQVRLDHCLVSVLVLSSHCVCWTLLTSGPEDLRTRGLLRMLNPVNLRTWWPGAVLRVGKVTQSKDI